MADTAASAAANNNSCSNSNPSSFNNCDGGLKFGDDLKPSNKMIVHSETLIVVSTPSSVVEFSSSDDSDAKKPVWNNYKPSFNDDTPSNVKPLVMDAFSWPALSKATGKLTSQPSKQSSLDDSLHNSQDDEDTGKSPSSSETQVTNNARINNNISPSPTNNVNNQQQQRNSFKNCNGRPNYRGHRGNNNQDWNAHQNFNGRDTYIPPTCVPRFPPPLPQPPLPYPPPQYFPSPPLPPYGGGHYIPPVQHFAAAPCGNFSGVSHRPPNSTRPVRFPAPDVQLRAKIVDQIHYYFSVNNLVKDMFLRKHMDEQGWVPISLIAGFKKVLELTDNIQTIKDVLRNSIIVEIQGDKIRLRENWKRWIIPASYELPDSLGSPRLGKSSQEKQTEESKSHPSKEKTDINDGAP